MAVHAAEEGEVAPEVVVEDDGEEDPTGPGHAQEEEQSSQSFADSAKELQEKLNQLRELLQARGQDVDPELMQRLGGLESQLQNLGTSLGSYGRESSDLAMSLYQGCMAMSVMRAGATRKSTREALRQLADGELTPEQASKKDLFKMVAVCITELTEEELAEFRHKTLKFLPKALAEKAQGADAAQQVIKLEADVWPELKAIATDMDKELAEGTGKPVQSMFSKSAMIVAGFAIFMLVKGFRAMLTRQWQARKKKQANQTKREKKKDK